MLFCRSDKKIKVLDLAYLREAWNNQLKEKSDKDPEEFSKVIIHSFNSI